MFDISSNTAIVLATFLGPIFAVFAARYLDNLTKQNEIKLNVFRILMATRRLALSMEWVGNLNLVPIIFNKNKRVMEAFNNLITHYHKDTSATKWLQELDSLKTKLLYAIANDVNIKIDQMDILEKHCSPLGWESDQIEIRNMRQYVLDLAEGKKSLQVSIKNQDL